MDEYTIKGPFRIKSKPLPSGGKEIDSEEFWTGATNKIKEKKGIYVYAIKPSKSKIHIPYYVGQAKKTFEQEVFQDRNCLKYNSALNEYKSGYPLIFFVIYPAKRGKVNRKEINEIEAQLIKLGLSMNPYIKNDRGINGFGWCISGVINSTKKQSSSGKQFGEMFGLKKEGRFTNPGRRNV